MTIDLSPEALAKLRKEIIPYSDLVAVSAHIILALIDALEEARGDAMHAVQALEGENAELRAKLSQSEHRAAIAEENYRTSTLAYGNLERALKKFPADEPPVGDQAHAAPIKGDKNVKEASPDVRAVDWWD